MRQIRRARIYDLNSIMPVIDAARGIMRSSGNVNQWIRGYPSVSVIEGDIERGVGYVVQDEDSIAGYFAFIPSPEPSYALIYDGAWLDESAQYHVVHRMASTPATHGIFRFIMDWCFGQDGNIRIDTHRDNCIMRHCIESYGFACCGIIYLESGDERLAYQLVK